MEPTNPTDDNSNSIDTSPLPVMPASPAIEPTVISPDSVAPTPVSGSTENTAASEVVSTTLQPIDPLHPAVMQAALNSSPDLSPTSAPLFPVAPQAPATSSPAVVVSNDWGGSPITTPVAQVAVSNPSKRRRPVKALLMALAAIVVLGGGSVAAYAGVIVPNKPANVLKAAFVHSLQQKQASFSGTLQGGPATGTGIAYKASFSGAEDTSKKAADFQLNLTVSGITFPVEARYVGQNLYVKVGDISTLTSLLTSYSPDLATLGQSLSSQLSSKWIEFDSTLLDEAGGSCILNASWALTPADVKLLENQYGKTPFVTIQSTTSDVVNGVKTEKMVLSLNDNKLANYVKNIGGLSLLKTIQSCDKGVSPTKDTSALADGDQTPLTIWINKSTKQIVQVSSTSTAADAKKDNIKDTVTISLKSGAASITAPTGAEPAAQLLAGLEATLGSSGVDLSSLLGSSDVTGTGSASNAQDAERQADIQSLQTQLEAYFAENGNYPSLTEMNNASWRQANMSGLDPNALNDPAGSSETLVAKPTANVYAYQVTNASGGSCESDAIQCAKYTLTATLSNGQAYAKNNLD